MDTTTSDHILTRARAVMIDDKEAEAARCLCKICIATVITRVLLLNKDRNDEVSHKCSRSLHLLNKLVMMLMYSRAELFASSVLTSITWPKIAGRVTQRGRLTGHGGSAKKYGVLGVTGLDISEHQGNNTEEWTSVVIY